MPIFDHPHTGSNLRRTQVAGFKRQLVASQRYDRIHITGASEGPPFYLDLSL
uniref:Uncharacterized protein n=1 Tax=Arundo donax TaxID=35708 RepID=A0A0A8ZMG9_ARUDO